MGNTLALAIKEVVMKNPWYVTGFTDGEGCFNISFNFRTKFKTGIEVRPSFSITLNKRDLNLLKEINDFFKVGGIRFSKKDQCYKYEVRNIKDLMKVIIPHYEKYQLQSAKENDFAKFSKICELIYNNKHKSINDLKEIIEMAYEMNPSGKRKIDKEKLLKQLAR